MNTTATKQIKTVVTKCYDCETETQCFICIQRKTMAGIRVNRVQKTGVCYASEDYNSFQRMVGTKQKTCL